MNTTNKPPLPKVAADGVLLFGWNRDRDERYTFPIWSQMARNHRVFFAGDETHKPETLATLGGHIEVLKMASDHREKNMATPIPETDIDENGYLK